MKNILSICILLLSTTAASAQFDGGILKKASGIFNGAKGSSLSSDQIVAGLKEALSLGAQKSANKLSIVDGFLKDAAVKILLPPQVQQLEKKMRMLGMGKLFDNAVNSMNHAAEDAAKSAAPIFLDAIKKMSVQDALGILRGSDTSATSYLKRSTSAQLSDAFRPVIDSSLKKVDATKYWKDVFVAYNKFSSTPVNTDINSYVTEKALQGIFYYVGEEEKDIRKNPAARVTDVLKQVFGGK